MVALIRRAGGVVIGKTVTTEFASLQPARTRNPHNLRTRPAARRPDRLRRSPRHGAGSRSAARPADQ
jgi:amidase